jgi:hypothetical protein
MGRWCTVTLRPAYNAAYRFSDRHDEDPWTAMADLAYSLRDREAVNRLRERNSHLYLRVHPPKMRVGERLLRELSIAIRDATVLVANNTDGTGEARYYVPAGGHLGEPVDTVDEGDLRFPGAEGELAAATVAANWGIQAAATLDAAYGSPDPNLMAHLFEDGRDLSDLLDGDGKGGEADA